MKKPIVFWTVLCALAFGANDAWAACASTCSGVLCGLCDNSPLNYCNAGRYCTEMLDSCSSGKGSCEPGYYCPSGSSSCYGNPRIVGGNNLCGGGNATYSGTCPCGENTWSSAGATANTPNGGCTTTHLDCEEGKYANGNGAIVDVNIGAAPGVYYHSAFSACGRTKHTRTDCASDGFSKIADACTSCPPASGFGGGSCTPCTAGQWSAGVQDTCKPNTATGCAANATSQTANACTNCAVGNGWTSVTGGGLCGPCSDGQWSAGNKTSCANCPSNSTSNSNKSSCNCADGHTVGGTWGGGTTTTTEPGCSIRTGVIKFNANSGTGNMPNQTYTWDDGQNLYANAFTNGTSYFLGWGANTSTKKYDNQQYLIFNTAAVAPDANLYAIWQSCAGACAASQNTNCTPSNLPVGATACACTGSCNPGYEGGTPNTCGQVCTPKKVTVTLDKQGGTGGPDTVYQKYANGWFSDAAATAAITSITTPTLSNHTFDGYWTSANCVGTKHIQVNGTLPTANNIFTDNATLYACWRYTASYDSNGATSGTAPAPITCTRGVVCNITANTLTRTGYNPNGWTDSLGNYYTTFISGTYTGGSLTLYAQWSAQCTEVIVDDQSGSGGAPAPIYLKYENGWHRNGGCTSPITQMDANPSRTGYTFGGYYTQTNGNGVQVAAPSGVLTTTHTLYNSGTPSKRMYANWTLIPYYITYVLNGGANHAGNPSQYNVEQLPITLKDPTRGEAIPPPASGNYSVFKGWCDVDINDSIIDGTCAVSRTIPSNSTGDKRFGAKWECNGYSYNELSADNEPICTPCPSNTAADPAATVITQCHIPPGAIFTDSNNIQFTFGTFSPNECYYNPPTNN